MTITNLDAELAALEDLVCGNITKSASDPKLKGGNYSEQDADKNVLEGDRANTTGSGVDANKLKGPIANEMNGSFDSTRPVEDNCTSDITTHYNIDDQKKKKKPESPLEKVSSLSNLADQIFLDFQKSANEGSSSEEMTEEEKAKKKKEEEEKAKAKAKAEEESMDKSAAYREGQKAFDNFINANGDQMIKQAAYNQEFNYGRYLCKQAHALIQEQQGRTMAKQAMDSLKKKNELSKEAQDKLYKSGHLLATTVLEKIAGDLISVRSIIDELVNKKLLTEDEKRMLVSDLQGSSDVNEEAILKATSGLANSEAIANALIKATKAVQKENIVPEPSQVTSAPAHPAEDANVDGVIPGDGSTNKDLDIDALAVKIAAEINKGLKNG